MIAVYPLLYQVSANRQLDNGEILSVSRDKAQEVKKKQMIYLRSFAYANS